MLEGRDRQKIIDRIKSMIVRCMYCDYPNPSQFSAIEYETIASGSHASAFLICPECRNKFMLRIKDWDVNLNSGSVLITTPCTLVRLKPLHIPTHLNLSER